jgi:transcriptional regulator with XRE-family HTH domain
MNKKFRQARSDKGYTLQQVAEHLKVDTALISRFEGGQRIPTRSQILGLAEFLEADSDEWLTDWLILKIKKVVKDETHAPSALRSVLKELDQDRPNHSLEDLWQEMQQLKNQLKK